jgi:hypothetical protein
MWDKEFWIYRKSISYVPVWAREITEKRRCSSSSRLELPAIVREATVWIERERDLLEEGKQIGNWRWGQALVLLFQAPHSRAWNYPPYLIPTNCWVSQNRHQQQACALEQDMWLEDKLVVETTKARRKRFKSCAHAGFARSPFNQFTTIHKLVATTPHTLGVGLEILSFFFHGFCLLFFFWLISFNSPRCHSMYEECQSISTIICTLWGFGILLCPQASSSMDSFFFFFLFRAFAHLL